MDRPEWICSDQRTDGSGICPVATEGNLFLRLRFWITSSKCLVLFLCPWLIKVLGTFLLYILLLPPPPPKVAHTHTHSHSLKGRDIREIWQSAESLDDALSQGKSHALNVCFGIEPATILLNILSHLPSTIWSTFSNASSTFPCSSFFSGHRNELCFMAS